MKIQHFQHLLKLLFLLLFCSGCVSTSAISSIPDYANTKSIIFEKPVDLPIKVIEVKQNKVEPIIDKVEPIIDKVYEKSFIVEPPIYSEITKLVTNKKTNIKNKSFEYKEGIVSFSVPTKMIIDSEEIVTLTLGENLPEKEIKKLEKTGVIDPIRIGSFMTASLVSSDSFKIVPLSSKEQIVTSGKPTTWKWSVIPIKEGKHKVNLVISIRYFLKEGQEEVWDYPVYNREILITSTFWYKIKKYINILAGLSAIVGGFSWLGIRLIRIKKRNSKLQTGGD